MRQNLLAGPAGTSPPHDGLYISRPVYNPYGMGIGAKQFEFTSDMSHEMVNHAVVPPGHFWCEWLSGQHLSIDYQQFEDGSWGVSSVWEGKHFSQNNLTKFQSWTKLSPRKTPQPASLPLELEFLTTFEIPFFNVELINNNIIEVHLRPGHLNFETLPVGTTLYPVWQGEDSPEGEWVQERNSDISGYKADGNLTDIRDGFIVVRNPHQLD